MIGCRHPCQCEFCHIFKDCLCGYEVPRLSRRESETKYIYLKFQELSLISEFVQVNEQITEESKQVQTSAWKVSA